jgi:amino acid adenylation domain-containing protein
MSISEQNVAAHKAYTTNECVSTLVAAQAHRTPNAPALIWSQGSMTYGEMNRRANLLAQYLRSLGVGRESVVALWLRRSPWVVVAALAAFKAQAAYLPLDPENPQERLLFMLRDSGAKVVLTDSSLAERTSGTPCPVVILDRICDSVAQYNAGDDGREASLHDLAYLIYTSGSTGTPKGVEITHANLANLIAWHNRAFAVTRDDCASHLAGLGFDASVWETWPYLATGASLCLADYQTLLSPENLRDWIIDSGVTIGFVPTPMAERLLSLEWPARTRMRTLLTGGDTLHVHPSPGLPFAVVNNYGPTECTVVATSGIVPASSSASLPTIGAPIDNTRIYLFDSRMQPVSPGDPGELYIGGAGVGRGYRNLPELTGERFVRAPFATDERLYKTGDMGIALPSGEIAFLGRKDTQVKLRGFRIELDEIAAVLNSHPEIAVSSVVLHGDGNGNGERHLVAYIVAAQKPSPRDLQEFLFTRLPDYMVPSVFVHLESLPLTANGKVDRTALPAPGAHNVLVEAVAAPSSEVEIRVAAIIGNLLKLSEIGADDDFFLLGGHSLLGTQLIARIRESFQVEMPLLALFENPTVRGLASEIEHLLNSNGHARAA